MFGAFVIPQPAQLCEAHTKYILNLETGQTGVKLVHILLLARLAEEGPGQMNYMNNYHCKINPKNPSGNIHG